LISEAGARLVVLLLVLVDRRLLLLTDVDEEAMLTNKEERVSKLINAIGIGRQKTRKNSV
jgi:hypothetical protein